MAARKVQLKDNSGNKAYPVTSSECVGMSDGSGSLDEKISGIISNSGYVTCTAAAGTAAKTVTQTNFTLSTNCRLIVKMANYNTAASPTLNVNNTGAKPLYYNGEVASADNTWEAGEVLDVYYDGTNYQASNIQGGAGAGGNQILEWDTNAATTRLQVAQRKRKKGMSITYVNANGTVINEQYIGDNVINAEWIKDTNWVGYSMGNSVRIGEVRNTCRLIGKMEIQRENFGQNRRMPIAFYNTANYAIYLETNFPTKSIAVTITNYYNAGTFNINAQDGVLIEGITSSNSPSGVIRVSTTQDMTEESDKVTLYFYDLDQNAPSIFKEIIRNQYNQIPFNYKKVLQFKHKLDINIIGSNNRVIKTQWNSGSIGDKDIIYSMAPIELTPKLEVKKYALIVNTIADSENSNIRISGLYLTLFYPTGNINEFSFNSNFNIISPGNIYEFEPKNATVTGLVFGCTIIGKSDLTIGDILELDVAIYEVYDNFEDTFKNSYIGKRVVDALGIKDIYNLDLVDTFQITPSDFNGQYYYRNVNYLEENTVYFAKVKSDNNLYSQISGVYALRETGSTSFLGASSAIRKNEGYFIFTVALEQYRAAIKAGEQLRLACACYNTLDYPNETYFAIEIYKVRIKNNIYDGLVNIAYPVDKKLPVGLTRVDISSESITVKSDHTLSGIPAKNVDFKYTFDNGKIFSSKADVNYQGTSSMSYAKKNLEFDLLDEEGESIDLRIGVWRPMDSYHLKANWIDATHCRNIICARIMEQIYMARAERPWDAYNDFTGGNLSRRIDTGALGHIDGFPVEVYINNQYVGLYTFNLKKHRSNYNMGKDNTNHIQLEMLGSSQMDAQPINWSVWEIRNPKSDSGNEEFAEGEEPNAGEVKTAIERLMGFANGATLVSPIYTKDDFKDYLNIPIWLDYILFNDFTGNFDGVRKNTQLCTWDGLHWSPLVYDMDSTFGMWFDGDDNTVSPFTNVVTLTGQKLTAKIYDLFADELQNRYIELRGSGIFSVGNVNKLISDFMVNIGEDGYKREHEIWTDIPSNIGGTRGTWYAGKDEILTFVKKKLIWMDVKYGLIRTQLFLD